MIFSALVSPLSMTFSSKRGCEDEEVPVFEEKQQSQVEDDGGQHRHPRRPVIVPLFIVLHQQAVGIVRLDGVGGTVVDLAVMHSHIFRT